MTKELIVHCAFHCDDGHVENCFIEREGDEVIMYEWENLYYNPKDDVVVNYLILKEFLRYSSMGYNVKIRRKNG